jgi:hypothetical protein
MGMSSQQITLSLFANDGRKTALPRRLSSRSLEDVLEIRSTLVTKASSRSLQQVEGASPATVEIAFRATLVQNDDNSEGSSRSLQEIPTVRRPSVMRTRSYDEPRKELPSKKLEHLKATKKESPPKETAQRKRLPRKDKPNH